ncbi:MAG TPA: 3D-(3,5/4)-trihydroxycyclohexane-1,2-dione acylhydrolase (decyclizing) [Bacteroidota bacterium]|nr:3D-(3,5/4)-trihydroxycyclohexane-1,2-dione acylhydrolase (decyclizing) [Bacteroidota bacterium]
METVRLTVGQATIAFLKNQFVERDGVEDRFFAGCFGIFGHGNVAGIGQALQENPDFRYYQTRNEQAMVHTAAAYAKMKNRLSTFVCTSSIGPGATNMITGAAAATINRLPVLLIPGDIFARRNVAPVLQQLESPGTQDFSVNDCFKPVSRYWDRINRPQQLISALPEVMRVLTSPADTGAAVLALPQDVQAEAFDFPADLLKKRVWKIQRPRPDAEVLQTAIEWIRQSRKPLIIAGGGTIYSGADAALRALLEMAGIPVAETFAGKGSVPYSQPGNLGAIGVTGTPGAAAMAMEADLIIGIGTRYTDFTTASKTAFRNPDVRFININVAAFDAFKHAALPVVGDAKVCLEEMVRSIKDFRTEDRWFAKSVDFQRGWDSTVSGYYQDKHQLPVSQAEVVGAVNSFSGPKDVVLCAAGSLPGDLHKLWRTRDVKGFHLEYGYSTMGYEIAAGLGAKMACPDREIYVMVGDGNYLMNNHEIITAIQEKIKMTIILLDNHGFKSIGSLSESVGSDRFGTLYRYRNEKTGQLDGENLPVDFALNARSLGAHVLSADSIASLNKALAEAKGIAKTTVIVIETDVKKGIDGYAWWEVAVAEVSEMASVREAYAVYQENKKHQRYYL